MRKIFSVLLAAALVGAVAAPPLWATNGMDMIGYSARSSGMGGADVAVDADATAVSGNPAVISTTAARSAALGVSVLMPALNYADMGGNDIEGEAQYFPMPTLGYAHKLGTSPLTLGLGLYAQGGMGVDFQDVMTPAGTRDELTSNVSFMRVNPILALEPMEGVSLGATVMVGYAQAQFSMFPETPGMNSGMEVEDLASMGYAGRVGAQVKLGEMVRVGATYTSESTIDLDGGTATLNFGPGGKVEYDAAMEDFTWPQEAEFGVAVLPAKGLTVAADVKWINWSAAIDKPLLKLSNPNSPVPPGYETIENEFAMNWDDQWVYAIGAEYVVNGTHALRAGFNYGKNPVPDENLNPLFPAIVESHATIGYGLALGSWIVDLAYEYAFENTQKNPLSGQEVSHAQNTVHAELSYRY